MALRVIRKRTTGSFGMDMVLTTAKMAADVTNIMQFPPAAAAASLILTIIQTVADIKVNQNDCFRLARRAARLLVDLGKRMEGKWDDAPRALLDNIAQFETTLISIREFMQKASEAGWFNRFKSKASIEDALTDYERLLDDAAMSFQMASLIEIHYAIGTLQRASSNGGPVDIVESPLAMSPSDGSNPFMLASSSSTLVYADPEAEDEAKKPSTVDSTSLSFVLVEEEEVVDVQEPSIHVPTEEDEFLVSISEATDEFGFRRYHQSDVIIRKANRKAIGWFSGTADAQANGQKMTIKRYDGPNNQAVRQWMKDIKMLRNLYHENLPQIMGYSDGKAQMPFILLASVPNRGINAYVQTALRSQGLAESAGLMLKLYRDITSAVLHVQQQMSFSDSQAQDFIEGATYTVDSDNNVVLGLPPLKEGWLTARSYNLAESLVDRALKYPKDVDKTESASDSYAVSRTSTAHRYQQLQSLLRSLLPSPSDEPALLAEIEDIIDEDEPVSLTALRKLSISQQRHDHSWQVRSPAGKWAVGDFGHIPLGSKDFDEFVKLGNVFEYEADGDDAEIVLEVVDETTGTQVQMVGGFHDRQQVSPYVLPDALEGWPIALLPQSNVTIFVRRETRLTSVNDAWKLLLARATALAEKYLVKPHNFLLLTRSLCVEDYQIYDRSPPPLRPRQPSNPAFPNQNSLGRGFGGGGFGGGGLAFQNAAPVPKLVYLFTSVKEGFSAYITDNAMGRPRPRASRSTSWMFSCQPGWPVGYVDYIQLDAEDVRE